MAKYILFDLDGTLTDSKPGIIKSVQYALQKCGVEVEDLETLHPFLGPPLRDSFQKFYGFDAAAAEVGAAAYRERFAKTGIFENALYDGIEDMLRALQRAGKIMLLATSKPAVYAERILAHFHIAPYFAFVSGSELDGRRSKKSEVIQYALDQAHITDLQEVVMVGDREHDVHGAKEIGCRVIGCLYGYGSYEELSRAQADVIVKDVHELQEILLS